MCVLFTYWPLDNQRSKCKNKETVKEEISVGTAVNFRLTEKKKINPTEQVFDSVDTCSAGQK